MLKIKESWKDKLFGSAVACQTKYNIAKYQSYKKKSQRKRLCSKLLLADWPPGY